MSWALIVSAGMGAANQAWGGEKEPDMNVPDEYLHAMWRLQNLQEQDVDFPTRKIAGLTDIEKFMQKLAFDYARSGTDPAIQTAISEATKTATEPVDITKMPEFKGTMEKILEGGRLDAQQWARSLQLSSGGNIGSPDRDILGRSITGTQERLTSALGGLFGQLRGLKAGAVNQLGTLGAQREAGRVSRLNVGTGASSLERQIQQMIYDANLEKSLKDIQMKYVVQPDYLKTIIGGSYGYLSGGGPTDFTKFMQGFQSGPSVAGMFGGMGGGGFSTAGGQGSSVNVSGSSFQNPQAVYGSPA